MGVVEVKVEEPGKHTQVGGAGGWLVKTIIKHVEDCVYLSLFYTLKHSIPFLTL